MYNIFSDILSLQYMEYGFKILVIMEITNKNSLKKYITVYGSVFYNKKDYKHDKKNDEYFGQYSLYLADF